MTEGLMYHHIGIACNDMDATARQYEGIGYRRGPKIVDKLQNIEICFLEHDTMPRMELLCAVNENSPIVQILKKNGTSPYHICYTVENIDDAIKKLKKQRFIVVSKSKPACALDNHNVAFLYHQDVGLIELLEK